MSRVAVPLLVLTTALAWSAPTLKERPGMDPAVVGEWVLKSLSQGGVPVAVNSIAAQTEFTAEGERISRNRNGVIVATARYRPDRTMTAPTFDVWTGDEPPTTRGVYTLNGDTLTIYYVTDPKADRPAKLESLAGSKVFMAVYERRRKD
jgi:uncharacterized protein (TIGR03067 family)